MRKTVLTTARLHQNTDNRARAAMLTLTYRDDAEYSPRDISDLLKRARHHAQRHGYPLRGVFVMETTKRGRPHYHILLWLPRGLSLPKPDKQGWWKKGSTRIEYVRHAVGYMAKYTSKGCSDGIPTGAHLYGAFGLDLAGRSELFWWRLPRWLRSQVEIGSGLRRLAGGGWYSPSTGEIFISPWEVRFEGGQVWIRLKSEKPPPFVLDVALLGSTQEAGTTPASVLHFLGWHNGRLPLVAALGNSALPRECS